MKPDLIMNEPIAAGTSIQFVFKAFFLIMITMIFFNLLLNFNLGGITPYAALLIFMVWWGFITSEYKLWKKTSAWAAVIFPILVLPVTIMLLGGFINYNILIFWLYISTCLYTFVYYLWAVHVNTGSFPFLVRKKQE